MTRTIHINGRFLRQPQSGVQRYAGEITRRLDERVGAGTASAHYELLTPPDAPSLDLRHIPQRAIGRRGGHLWDQIDFAWAARRGVALCLAASGPVALRRQLAVIHDAAVQRHPELFSTTYVRVHNTIDKLLARRAHLATVSDFSRRELAEVLHVDAGNILVAPNGAEHLTLAPDGGVIERLGLAETPYFLVLGNITRNKNLAVAMRALERLQPSSVKLVAVGRLEEGVFGKGYLPPKSPALVLAGRLDDAAVAGLMRDARALIFPSLYEGFGIPPLEAMSNNCPVLASTAAAVRETCGDAVDYFEPHDDAALAALMRVALEDEGDWRQARIRAGRARLGVFSWARSAATLATAVERIAARG